MASTVPAPEPAPGAAASASDSAPGYAVKLPIFEGPLDLLLHLIRINEVDIADIPIVRIAEQYLEYVELMRELDLDVAGEYLVMAATLAWIKSRVLLPPPESEEEEEAGDPRAELVARLLEYQRYKEASETLAERPRLGRDVFAPQPPSPEPTPEAEREIEVGLVPLLDAFRRLMRAARAQSVVHEVETESYTVRERMQVVMEVLAERDGTSLDELFDLRGEGRPSVPLLIATFLGLLELVRLEAVRIYQGLGEDEVPCGPIRLRRGEGDPSDWAGRIAEIM